MKCFTRLYGSYGLGKVVAFAAFVLFGVLMSWRYGASIYWRNNSVRLDEDAILAEKVVLKADAPLCTPRQNIAFLYTHATGGHILQNILLRRVNADDRGPLAVMPAANGSIYLGNYPDPIRPADLPPLKPGIDRRFGVLTHSTRWNHESMRQSLPNDTVYVALLRDPVHHFRSLYRAQDLQQFYNATLEEFAMRDRNATSRRKGGKFGTNQMAFDLGIEVGAILNDADAIWRAATQLDSQFHLVALSEQMEESLVLLREMMCWSIDDVVSLSRLVDVGTGEEVDPAVIVGLEQRNLVDKMLYDYFGTRLRARITEFGEERMAVERSRLTDRTRRWREYCVEPAVAATDAAGSEGMESSFALREEQNATCVDLTRSAAQLTDALRSKQASFLQ